jgi:hypothetical protein
MVVDDITDMVVCERELRGERGRVDLRCQNHCIDAPETSSLGIALPSQKDYFGEKNILNNLNQKPNVSNAMRDNITVIDDVARMVSYPLQEVIRRCIRIVIARCTRIVSIQMYSRRTGREATAPASSPKWCQWCQARRAGLQGRDGRRVPCRLRASDQSK